MTWGLRAGSVSEDVRLVRQLRCPPEMRSSGAGFWVGIGAAGYGGMDKNDAAGLQVGDRLYS